MGISALSFSFFRENSLISIMGSLYASCMFALLYSEKTNSIITINETHDSLIELKFDRFATKGFFGNSIKCFKKNLMTFSNEEICKYFEVLITKRKELYKESIEIYDNESFTNSHI